MAVGASYFYRHLKKILIDLGMAAQGFHHRFWMCFTFGIVDSHLYITQV